MSFSAICSFSRSCGVLAAIMVITRCWGWLQLYTHIVHYFTIWTFPFFLLYKAYLASAALEEPMKNRLRVLRAEREVVAGRPGRAAGGVAPVGECD